MWFPMTMMCLLSFTLGIAATNSWHDFYTKYMFSQEKCKKGGVHDWRLIQVFTEDGVDYFDQEILLHECNKCHKRK